MKCLVIVILSLLAGGVQSRPGAHSGSGLLVERHDFDNVRKDSSCGYQSCPIPKRGMTNVHLVPHSHDDVGWLKTVDQYYYGSKTNYQRAGVQYILDSVIEALLHNPERKFIYVESAFFFKWWDEQTVELQDAVKELVEQGRLQFVGGAWSMNDEAASHYQSLIDQFTWGLRMLNDTFGECGRPLTGWQIDPFGHSREQASLFAQMGYDGMFFARLDWNDKSKRLSNKEAEMIWKASKNLDESDLFTSVLYNHYSAPPGFCFDVLCSDDPFVDGPFSAENNVKERVDAFLYFVGNMSTKYRSNNLLITMGDDFNYMDANMNFKNMDKLIKYTNARQSQESKVNVFYSTPSCYLKALHDAELTWPAKTDDFFPYASDPHAYWTGYFTSRPTSKRYERIGNHFLQVCKQLTAIALSSTDESYQENLAHLREVIGVMQHHDAITGTEKQHVADDYARMIHKAIDECGENTDVALNSLASRTNRMELKFESCHQLNISLCDITETKQSFIVTLYNPLAHASYQYVRLPVNGYNYKVRDSVGTELPIQIISVTKPVTELVSRVSTATEELIYLADEIPPMGYKSFYVTEIHEKNRKTEPQPKQQTTSIGNEYLTLTFNDNGLLSTINIDGRGYNLQQDFLFYEGAYGNNEVFENRSSGAYILRPNGTVTNIGASPQIRVVLGDHVQEVHQIFNQWVSQVIRVYKHEKHVEFEWMVGPIPIEDGKGKEIVTRYYSDIQSAGTFWTDSNGREMIKRIRNHRETWDLELAEPVAGNYYPVTAKIALEDDQLRMAVLNDRAQGGTSLQDGVLELMVHRRLLRDDAFGVGEALNETAYGAGLIARGKHYLLFGPKTSQQGVSLQASERFLQNQVLTPPWLFVSDATGLSFEAWQTSFNSAFTPLSGSMPANVNLLTFEPWKGSNSFLIRFEHLLEKDEDPRYSQPVTIDLQSVFSKFRIVSARETTLAGNQWKEDSSRLKFFFDAVPITQETKVTKAEEAGLEFTLNPMEIKTFVLEMEMVF
ncbi:lysosomal alpha-mannosidase-like isoform X1 [Topomyia yanbarensis]|uniref:lysosomal alpha-mannosidase-like isoform X1 n=1 Tax=Topomyia yanbarensis TaxID=2498891 RepID=UPI00273B3525|nr:lysosomal alpha-mannosidase-like isoform X1 [Topomyia yanbarensis]